LARQLDHRLKAATPASGFCISCEKL